MLPMRYSKAFIPTLKEDPSDAVLASHKLMLRAGMIKKVASGIYSYLPFGWRVLQKISQIIVSKFLLGNIAVVNIKVLGIEIFENFGKEGHRKIPTPRRIRS